MNTATPFLKRTLVCLALVAGTHHAAAHDAGDLVLTGAELKLFSSVPPEAVDKLPLRLGFRYRTFEAADAATQRPEQIRDGLLRISYELDRVLVEDIQLTVPKGSGSAPLPQRVVTEYSFATGERTRHMTLRGGGAGTVVVGWWKTLPMILRLGLGTPFRPGDLNGTEVLARETLENSLTRLAFSTAGGDEARIDYLPGPSPEVHSMLLEPARSGGYRRVTFRDSVQWSADHPKRPSVIVDGTWGASGELQEATCWASISSPWVDEPWDPSLNKNEDVLDLRGRSGTLQAAKNDRPRGLGETANWPALAVLTPMPNLQLDVAASALPVAKDSQGFVPLILLGLLVTGLILLIGARTRTTRNSQ